ncbi:MAG: 4a-hydroxytetrahydrobiopterin dehydratase [Candidatus Dadabacteria bacterium]|nr:4a-hydroxytetrahydrobiopterin dehydratase [Candidatus Dadabacteria bacterium]NIS08724.1 4a-hydroxytetrahydrobiopterin dehydratase [Candidatus Dadabacteria bacterium]NIV42608.1 4a-hydroxytetrahydrobiopterin dehydratase [Candidatus Dadabacteria bacterium]NIX15410.1 4a-hydroxytetrahydrobiopterin dehydratase [Candidatus Dadabacteria bacterium]NIY22073.1 4a-hydroxytetrahydrobiopterin dehydratase [Candidatus Dadabacteria bacterium]
MLLSQQDIEKNLMGLDGWGQAGLEIEKQYRFNNFIESIGFVNKVAILAEKADHHPDILIQYSKVKISLSTHSEGGITEKDFSLAREIEAVS